MLKLGKVELAYSILGFADVKNEFDQRKLVFLYRYISWLITSLFYLVGEPRGPILFKIGVVVSLFIAARIVTLVYLQDHTEMQVIKTTVLVETLGITLLLLPTGGLNSPFIWYALNPVLVAASFLSPIYCWIDLLFYLGSAMTITLFLFSEKLPNGQELLLSNSHRFLVFILITLAVQLLSKLANQLAVHSKALSQQSHELQEVNEELQDLYRVIEACNSQDDLSEVLRSFTSYASRLTQRNKSFIWLAPNEKTGRTLIVNEDGEVDFEKELLDAINHFQLSEGANNDYLKVGNEIFTIIIVKSYSRIYGILGFILNDSQRKQNSVSGQLKFIAELLTMVLERYYLERLSRQFILNGEQNRIANEIHDSVSQRLFSVVYGIHALKSSWSNLEADQIQERLNLIADSSNQASQELRSSIFRLSSIKRGEKDFVESLQMYLQGFSRLNEIQVDFEVTGDPENLSSDLKRSLVRIIREVTGNSVRHGKSRRIKVDLTVFGDLKLIIQDDGEGFDINSTSSRSPGLGIKNIRTLTEAVHGILDIESLHGKGTQVMVCIPEQSVLRSQEFEGGVA